MESQALNRSYSMRVPTWRTSRNLSATETHSRCFSPLMTMKGVADTYDGDPPGTPIWPAASGWRWRTVDRAGRLKRPSGLDVERGVVLQPRYRGFSSAGALASGEMRRALEAGVCRGLSMG